MSDFWEKTLNKPVIAKTVAAPTVAVKEEKAEVKETKLQTIDKKKLAFGAAAAAGVAALAIGSVLLHKKLGTKFVEESLEDGGTLIKKIFKGKLVETKKFDADGILRRVEEGIEENLDGSTFIKKITHSVGDWIHEVEEDIIERADTSRFIKKSTSYWSHGTLVGISEDIEERVDGSSFIKKLTRYHDGVLLNIQEDVENNADASRFIKKIVVYSDDGKPYKVAEGIRQAAHSIERSLTEPLIAEKLTEFSQEGQVVSGNIAIPILLFG